MKRKRILLVDDDVSILEVFKLVFDDEGYSVDAVDTGKEALKKVETEFYNLALLDIKLPDMDGTELLAKIHRKMPLTINVMITGYPGLDNAIESLNLGAAAYVMKPINMIQLLDTMKKKLSEQDEAENISEERVTKWIEARLRKAKGEREIDDEKVAKWIEARVRKADGERGIDDAGHLR